MFAFIVPLSAIGGGMYPDNSLPYPGHWGGRPDQGLPGQGGHPWFPGHGGGPRPDQGLPGHGHASGQPIPLPPNQPWPPGVNPPIVPPDPPPASIWPPFPPGEAMTKALVAIYVSGYGTRYAVIDVPQPK